MKLSPAARDSYGILFAEDFDDEDAPPFHHDLEAPGQPAAVAHTPAPPPPTYTAADLAEAQRAAQEAGYAEGFAAASETASMTGMSVLAALAERLSATRGDFDAMVARQLDDVTGATLAIVSACLPVLCEQAGARDLVAVLQDLLPSLVGEPELVVTVHPDHAAMVERELGPILGKNTPLQVQTSPSMGRSDVDVAWRSGNAKRNTRALRREVTQMLRRSLRAHGSSHGSGPMTNEEHRHGR